MSNVFLDYGEQASRRKTVAKGVAKSDAKAEQQAARWRRHHAKRVEALLAGPYGAMARQLVAFLEHMTMSQASALIELVKPWRQADADTRFMVLGLVDTAIVGLRERTRMPPFDDPLPGAPSNVFQTIKGILETDNDPR